MEGHLFDGFYVKIDPGVRGQHGAWSRKPPYYATDQGLLKLFYGKLTRFENPVILDVGASTGCFCLLAAFYEMRVHAFEPYREAYEVLERNIALNGLENKVTAYHLALSSVDGKAYLNVPTECKVSRATLGEPRFKSRQVRVQVRKLDSLKLGRIDVMKVDTEGGEYNVLLGAEETIREYKPDLLLEYREAEASQFGHKPQEIRELLESWGYRHFQICGNSQQDLWVEFKI